jgi:hypothetical protein
MMVSLRAFNRCCASSDSFTLIPNFGSCVVPRLERFGALHPIVVAAQQMRMISFVFILVE